MVRNPKKQNVPIFLEEKDKWPLFALDGDEKEKII